PVIPDFGHGTACLRQNHWFCTSWVHEHWGDTLERALPPHISLSLLAVGIGFGISFVLAVLAFRFRFLGPPLGAVSDVLYCIPRIALFLLLVPVTRPA